MAEFMLPFERNARLASRKKRPNTVRVSVPSPAYVYFFSSEAFFFLPHLIDDARGAGSV
jgi:hypothetical protein